jgi:hypothetical protein
MMSIRIGPDVRTLESSRRLPAAISLQSSMGCTVNVTEFGVELDISVLDLLFVS